MGQPMGTFGKTGLTEILLVNIDGRYNCGVQDASKTLFHEGWTASRQCECENYKIADSCGLPMPRPFLLFGTHPRLCKKQEGPPFWNRWKVCDASTCKATRCRRRPSGTSSVESGQVAPGLLV